MVYTKNLLCWLEKVLFERFGVDFALHLHEDRWVLSVPGLDGCIEFMRAHTSFAVTAGTTPCTRWNAYASGFQAAIANELPTPGAATLPEPLVTVIEGGVRVGYDIFALAAWMLTRQEEIGAEDLDGHSRFPAVASHAHAHGYLERPVVDEWLHILRQIIRRLWPSLELQRSTFSTAVSHDVDAPSRSGFSPMLEVVRLATSDALKRRNLKLALGTFQSRLQTRTSLSKVDPFNTFEWLMDCAEARGLRAAFYFICGRTVKSRDALYELEHPAIRALLRSIHRRGHEIGLHPSYGTYLAPGAIAKEAARLRQVCAEEGVHQENWGGRMHYLRWRHPDTLREWDVAGMTYDSTLGYADHPGFRCGTCYEYPAYDAEKDQILNVRIRPLVVMEATVMASWYLGLGASEKAKEKFLMLKERCRRVGGVFTLLWHNSELVEQEKRELYKFVLDN